MKHENIFNLRQIPNIKPVKKATTMDLCTGETGAKLLNVRVLGLITAALWFHILGNTFSFNVG